MGYYPTPRKVQEHREELDLIAQAVAAGATLEFSPAQGQSIAARRHQIRNILKSAAAHPQREYDDQLDSKVELSITKKPGVVTLIPKSQDLGLSDAASELPTYRDAISDLYNAKEQPAGTEGQVRWCEREQGDRETFEEITQGPSGISGIRVTHQSTKTLGDSHIYTYSWISVSEREQSDEGTPLADEYDSDSDPYASVLDKYSD